MTVEKINGTETTPIISKQDFKEDEPKAAVKTAGSTKDVVTALSVLAAFGAAGVAVYKHKNAKDAIKKAETEAKKKIKEAEEQAKKAAEETDKKIQEAVEKAKQEFENKKPKSIPEGKPDKPGKTPKPSSPAPKPKGGEKPSTEASGETDTYKPVKPEMPKEKSIILEGEVRDTELDTIDEDFLNRMNENRKKTFIIPERTAFADFVQKTTDTIKEKYNKIIKKLKRTPKQDKPVTPDPKPDTQAEPKTKENKTPVFAGVTTRISGTVKHVADYFNGKYTEVKDFFNHLKAKRRIKKFYDKGAREGIEYLNNEEIQKNANKLVSSKMNEAWLEKQHELREKEYQKLFEEFFEKELKEAPEADLLKEYSALKDAVKDMSSTDYKAQRLLEIQAELMNHRGYIFKDGKLVKSVRSFYDEGAEKGLHQLELQEDAKRYTKLASDIKNENWQQEQRKLKEQEYKKLFDEYFDEQLKKASDLDLLVEYHILKRILKNRPVTDPDVQRFLEIQGELVNHRGYKVKPDGKIINLSVSRSKESFIDKIKHFFKF